ncbi:MAG: Glycosyl transferase group 1 [Parcubacteria group bacterium GW2011_GWA2_51_10]|nr:MAG: Glycosyl transferase group 1 [Parcubacteria group bacterium GW2011_GWA2_51_10]
MSKQRQTSNGARRILIFSLTYHPFVGGAEIAIKEITDRLSKEKYAFDMITLRFDRALPKVEKVGNVTVYRLGPAIRAPSVSDRNMKWQLRLAKVLFPISSFIKAFFLDQKYVYDMLWAMMANQASFSALFFKFIHPKTPYFLELQDGRAIADMKARRPILRLLWPLYKRMYMKADRIKAISHYIAKEVRSIGYKKDIEVIPNGVDVGTFTRPSPPSRVEELKKKVGKHPGDIFLFTASRLVLSRGVEDVIRALPALPAHVKLLVAGTGEDQQKLERIASEAGIQERVIFAGHVPHEILPAYFAISDIFVRPSIIEGFGSAFIEAFAVGIPVIATPVGGIPDFLFDPDANPDKEPTGLFCEVQNPESIARCVTRYMEEPKLKARIIKNARALASEKYDWNRIARDMEERIFDPLLKSI